MPEEPDAFERLAQALMSGVARLGQTLIDVLNPLGLALEVVSELRGKIKAAVQNTLQALSACVRSVRQQAQKSLPLIASALRSALRVLIDGLARCVTFLVNLTGVGGIANKLKQLIDALAKAVNGIVDKIIQTIGGVGGSIVSTAREIERAIGDLPNLVLA
jgi:phage-related protein